MLKDKFIQEEIWKLKNKDKTKTEENSIPPNLIDGPVTQRNLKDEKIIKLASGSSLDELVEAQQFMHELFEKEIDAGNIPSSMSYDDWIISLRTSLGGGGRVIKFSDFHKPKSVKEIKLSDYFDLSRKISSMNKSELDTLKWLLNKSLNPKK